MSLKRILIKNSLLNVASYLYLIITSFVSIPIILSSLGNNIYGILILFTSLVPIISTIDFGLSSASIRWLSLPIVDKNKQKKVWQTSFWLFLVSAFLIAIVSIFILLYILKTLPALASMDNHRYLTMTFILSAILFINHLNSHFLSLPQAKQRFDIYNIRTFLVGTGNTLGTALVAYLSHSLIIILIFQFGVHFLNAIIFFFWNKRQFTSHFWPQLDLKVAKELIHFGMRNFTGKLANQIRAQFGTYILGGMLSATAVTAFNIPQNIIIKGAGGVSQLTLAFFPMSTSLTTKKRIYQLVRLIIGLEILILFLGLLQIFFVYTIGESFLLWWLKDIDLVKMAYPVLRVLSFFFLLTTLTTIPSSVLDAINYPQIPSLFATLNAIITISLMLVFTPYLGILGPSYAIVISSTILVPTFLTVFSVILTRSPVWKI